MQICFGVFFTIIQAFLNVLLKSHVGYDCNYLNMFIIHESKSLKKNQYIYRFCTFVTSAAAFSFLTKPKTYEVHFPSELQTLIIFTVMTEKQYVITQYCLSCCWARLTHNIHMRDNPHPQSLY